MSGVSGVRVLDAESDDRGMRLTVETDQQVEGCRGCGHGGMTRIGRSAATNRGSRDRPVPWQPEDHDARAGRRWRAAAGAHRQPRPGRRQLSAGPVARRAPGRSVRAGSAADHSRAAARRQGVLLAGDAGVAGSRGIVAVIPERADQAGHRKHRGSRGDRPVGCHREDDKNRTSPSGSSTGSRTGAAS